MLRDAHELPTREGPLVNPGGNRVLRLQGRALETHGEPPRTIRREIEERVVAHVRVHDGDGRTRRIDERQVGDLVRCEREVRGLGAARHGLLAAELGRRRVPADRVRPRDLDVGAFPVHGDFTLPPRLEAVGRAVRAGNQADAPVPEVGERLLRLKIDGGLLVDGRRNRAGDPPRRDADGLAAFGKRPSIDDEIDGTRHDDRQPVADDFNRPGRAVQADFVSPADGAGDTRSVRTKETWRERRAQQNCPHRQPIRKWPHNPYCPRAGLAHSFPRDETSSELSTIPRTPQTTIGTSPTINSTRFFRTRTFFSRP